MKLPWFKTEVEKKLELQNELSEAILEANVEKRQLEDEYNKLVEIVRRKEQQATESWKDKELPKVITEYKHKIPFFEYEDVCIPLREIITIILVGKGSKGFVEKFTYTDPVIYRGHVCVSKHDTPNQIIEESPAVIQIVYRGGLFNIEVSPFFRDAFYTHIKKEWKNNYGS